MGDYNFLKRYFHFTFCFNFIEIIIIINQNEKQMAFIQKEIIYSNFMGHYYPENQDTL